MGDGEYPGVEMERRASLDQVVPDPAALKDVPGHRVGLSEPQGRPGLQMINVLLWDRLTTPGVQVINVQNPFVG